MKDRIVHRAVRIAANSTLIFCIVFSSIISHADNGKNASASIMRLEKIIGNVKLTNSSGDVSQVIEKMRLNGGDDVASSAKSYAYISLDDNKAVKLDAKSDALVTKNNQKYEVVLQAGNLLFEVDKELQADEGFEIKTANLTMGIRGTCAQVERKSSNHTSVSLLEGSLLCTVTDPATGNSQSIHLSPGYHADFYTGSAYENGCNIITRRIVYADLRGFTLRHIFENSATSQRIYEQTGLDLRNLGKQQVDTRQAFDEAEPAPVPDQSDFGQQTGTGGAGDDNSSGGIISGNDGRDSPTADWYLDKYLEENAADDN